VRRKKKFKEKGKVSGGKEIFRRKLKREEEEKKEKGKVSGGKEFFRRKLKREEEEKFSGES
jgi:hypothetical protein